MTISKQPGIPSGILDPGIPLYDLASMEARLREAIQHERFALGVFVAFGVLALMLAGGGTYGVLALAQHRRAREIGIRRTLGAPSGSIVRTVAGGGLLGVGAGLVLGSAGALVFARLLETLFPTVSGGSAGSVAWAVAALALTGVLATVVPVVRALAARSGPGARGGVRGGSDRSLYPPDSRRRLDPSMISAFHEESGPFSDPG